MVARSHRSKGKLESKDWMKGDANGMANQGNDRVWLFDGTGLEGWVAQEGGGAPDWTLHDGVMTVKKGNIVSRQTFGDAHIHVEFACPDMPWREGQGKGNSGVYIHGAYEIQVLDSYGVEPPTDGDCAAIYGLQTPLCNACRPPEEWQTYDIVFRAPRIGGGGEVLEKARLTLLFNGAVVHNNLVLERATPGGVTEEIRAEGPLLLQDHGDPVRYRNVWLKRL